METDGAQGVRGRGLAGAPTGLRRLTPRLLAAEREAAGFDGLPAGVTAPGQVLAAFKAAAPCLGLSPRLVHAIDWLFRFTQPQDWGRGGRPIVWPSAAMQQEALGLSETRVKALNRALIEAGLITMKDSPNGKRYGRRDAKQRITEAYGFDLSPLATRHGEFLRLAVAARAERAEMGRLRRRATISRNGITQILETVADYGFRGEEWVRLDRETRDLARALRRLEQLAEVALAVETLERRQCFARERLETLLAGAVEGAPGSVNSDPKGAENGPHQYTYKPSLYPDQDTVMAPDGCKSAPPGIFSASETVAAAHGGKTESRAGEAKPTGAGKETVLRLTADELTQLAPRLRVYLGTASPAWAEVIDAADWLRGELGVSRSLWGEACLAMGREQAAIAIAVISAKDPGHFRTTPGGYFHGMVAKAKAGELNLIRTIWGLRQAAEAKTGRMPGKAGEGRVISRWI